jgi:hypothetical protein
VDHPSPDVGRLNPRGRLPRPESGSRIGTTVSDHDLTILDPRSGDVVGRLRDATEERCSAAVAGFGYGPELLDEMTKTKVVHLSSPQAG